MKNKRKWITVKVLKELDACSEGVKMFEAEYGKSRVDIITLTESEIKRGDERRLSYMNWLIVRCMYKKQYLQYAIFAAREVLHIFEEKYPGDKRPRKAIEAAEKCLKNPRGKDTAHYVAKAAAYASKAAAYAAAYAADYASKAADAADAADYAAYASKAADYAADAAKIKLQIKILKHGIELLETEDKSTRIKKQINRR